MNIYLISVEVKICDFMLYSIEKCYVDVKNQENFDFFNIVFLSFISFSDSTF